MITGGVTSDARLTFTNHRAFPETNGSLSVQTFGEGGGCVVDLLLERTGVTAAGWIDSNALRYVANGALYHYTVGTQDPLIMVDPQNDEWSRGRYLIVDFNHDATVFAAISTNELDQDVYIFRRVDDGDPEPWPDESTNRLTGPILWPSFERFESVQ